MNSSRIQRLPSAEGDLQLSSGLRVGVGNRRLITIDSRLLDSPTNVYDADVSWLEYREGSPVSLFFAKEDRDHEKRLKTRLQIKFPAEDFVRHFWANSRAFHETVRKILSGLSAVEWRNVIKPESWPAEKEHSEWVNFEYMAVSGTQAAIDFYNLHVGGIARYSMGQGTAGLELKPVVRVQLTAFELLRLLDAGHAIVDTIKTHIPATMLMEEGAAPAGREASEQQS